MFVDIVKIEITAGNGGDGIVSYRREKYVPTGGPDGGDGGKGGNVYFLADTNLSTLMDFRFQRKFSAPNGEGGRGKKSSGRGGEDLIIRVPKGTLVKVVGTERILADVSGEEKVLVAKGGRGGWGNQHFATPTRQTPDFARPGQVGEVFHITLELKLLADVGLAGIPNAGKSSLISVVSAAKPKIADYPFTTLIPNLGVVSIAQGKSFVVADIPGLIEGASDGVGLGHDFLRHIERCRMIVHVVDLSGLEGRDPIQDFETILNELEKYNPALAALPQIVAGNKIDIAPAENIERFRVYIEERELAFFPISAATGEGTRELMQAVGTLLDTLPPIKEYPKELLPEAAANKNKFSITIEDGVYVVEADWLMQILRAVNMDDYSSLQYFQRVLRQSGILDKLVAMGIQEEDTVRIFDFEFDYIA